MADPVSQTTDDDTEAEIVALIRDGILTPFPEDYEQPELDPVVRRIIYGE